MAEIVAPTLRNSINQLADSVDRTSMGTWGSGPFDNDEALDFVGEIVDQLMLRVDDFIATPMIDETFDSALAAVAVLNEVMSRSPVRPFDEQAGAERDPAPIRQAMMSCYDSQIDGMEPEPDFKAEKREVVEAEMDRFVAYFNRG